MHQAVLVTLEQDLVEKKKQEREAANVLVNSPPGEAKTRAVEQFQAARQQREAVAKELDQQKRLLLDISTAIEETKETEQVTEDSRLAQELHKEEKFLQREDYLRKLMVGSHHVQTRASMHLDGMIKENFPDRMPSVDSLGSLSAEALQGLLTPKRGVNVAGLQDRAKEAKQAKEMEKEMAKIEEANKQQQQEIDDLNARYLQAQQRMLEAKKKRADLETSREEMSRKVEEIEKAQLAPTEPCSTMTPRLGLRFDLEHIYIYIFFFPHDQASSYSSSYSRTSSWEGC